MSEVLRIEGRRRVRAALMRGWLVVLVGVLSAASVACFGDDAPSGPGDVTLSVQGSEPLGAVVVELTGGEVTSVDGPADAWIAMEPIGTATDGSPRYRLVIVLRQAGVPQVRLRVPDVAQPLPVATLVDATGADDAPVASLGSVAVDVRL